MLGLAVNDGETFMSPVAQRRLRSSLHRTERYLLEPKVTVLVVEFELVASMLAAYLFVCFWRHFRFLIFGARRLSRRGDEASHNTSVYCRCGDKCNVKLQYIPLSTVLVTLV